MTRTINIFCAIVAALVFPSVAANAVDDTTAPVLTDFTLTSSASIDTGPGTVSFTWTATATDELSGVKVIVVHLNDGGLGNSYVGQSLRGDLEFTGSGSTTLPRYSEYATYNIFVTVQDHARNTRTWQANAPETGGYYDLCDIDTPCQIVNAAP
jgi:hypothetical protein